jgi:aldehyde dehydrogenase (NAD+)
MKTYKLFINNRWKEAKDGKTLKTINPTNGQVLAEIASASLEDVDLAVSAARKAFNL